MPGNDVDRPLPKAEKFEITIDFGPHQAKLSIRPDVGSADEIAAWIGKQLEPHIKSMLAAEEKNHADSAGA